MVSILALFSALTCGSADFLGGLSTRNNSATAVVTWSQGVGLIIVLIAAPLLEVSRLGPEDLSWGMAAGLAGAIGVAVLYRGLADGLASVVSPVAALTGAVLPILFALTIGERPELISWLGVGLALPAIFLLSMGKSDQRHHVVKSLGWGILSGCGFGGFFILIAQTGDASGMWPLVAARALSVPVFLGYTIHQHKSLMLNGQSLIYALLAGLLDMSANIFYLLATRTGFLITAVVITALYPAPTVILQRIFRNEKLNLWRIIGLVLALVGAALIGLGE